MAETKRLTIAPCSQADAADLREIVRDPMVANLFFVGRSTEVDYREAIAEYMEGDWQQHGRLHLAARTHSGIVVGGVSFNRIPREADSLLSYFVSPRLWCRGYGMEMVTAACSALPVELGVRTIEATVIRENSGSKRILEKLGFRFCGIYQDSGGVEFAPMLRYRLVGQLETTPGYT
ncbi:MAG: GNAT family N-acetyltransferase [Sedimenticola sp.]